MVNLLSILKAFAEKTRLRILRLISTQELAVNELVETLNVPQSRISRHLSVLRGLGLVQDRREGNCIYYRMAVDEINPFARSLWQSLRAFQHDSKFFPEDFERLRQTLARREVRSKEYFDVVQAEWDRIRRNYIDDALSFLVVASLIRPDAVAVDIGTGTGELLLSLASSAAKVVGVDRSEKMLDACRQRVRQSGLTNVELLRGDAEALPLPDEMCDTAFSSMLLHHLANPARGVKEMSRIVRPSGRVVISDLVEHNYDWTREVMADVWLGFTEEQIRGWLAAAGLADTTYSSTKVPSPLAPDAPAKLRAFIATGTKPAK